MTAFKRQVKDGGGGGSRNQTRLEGTWEWAPFLWVLLSRRANKGAAHSLYLGLGLASYINLRIKEVALPCCGCVGGDYRRLREAEAEATEAYLRQVCRLKEEGRQLKCQCKNRKSRAVLNFIFLRSIAWFCMLYSQNAERLSKADPGWLVQKVMGEAG